MLTDARRRCHRFAIGLATVAMICVAGGLVAVMQAQAGGTSRQPAAQVSRSPQSGAPYAAGEVLVRLRAGASPSGKRALASSLGSVKLRDLRVRAILPRGERILLCTSATLTGDALVQNALRSPDVIAASLNYRRYLCAAAVYPDDPDFSGLWGLDNTGQSGGTAGADISAPEAWSVTTGSSSLVIADIDSGVAYDHPDLAANMWHNPGEIPANGIDDDGNGYVDDVYGIDAVNGDSDPHDDRGHGTHTAGTMAAVGDNGIGITGVAWQARLMALKFLPADGDGTDADAITCIDYVVNEKLKHGVNVVAINASWGGVDYNGLLRTAINAAGAAGIIFCAGAGNGGGDDIGDDTDAEPFYPASYDCANIISVAATDDDDALAAWSNYGATRVDLAAPGVDIFSTVPAVAVSLDDVAFSDATHGWAVSTGGTIFATTDGGAAWSPQGSGNVAWLYGVAFSDASHGWVVGWDGTILATTDGGASWAKQSSGSTAWLDDVAFSDAGHGWAVGDAGTILATTDGGATWSAQSSGSSLRLTSAAFSDATHGWVVGRGGTILATTNGGATWIPHSSGTTASLWCVALGDATHGWAVGNGGTILATTDGGATWIPQSSGATASLAGVAFSDATHGWAVGNGGTILATTDGGATWIPQSSGTTASLHAVAFSDAAHGWAVGDRGTILVTANGGATWSTKSSGNGYDNRGGTSMAAPHVTGAVALCAARFPSETVAQRVQRVLSHVDQLATLRGKTSTGGRLDVAAALTHGAESPSISGLKPASGKRGALVTLSGTGFGAAKGAGSVKFGSTKCTTYVSWSATQIRARVPAKAKLRRREGHGDDPRGQEQRQELHGEAVEARPPQVGLRGAPLLDARDESDAREDAERRVQDRS